MSENETVPANADASFSILMHTCTNRVMRMFFWQVIGFIIGIPLNTVPLINEWCKAHRKSGEFLSYTVIYAAAFNTSNIFLKSITAVITAYPSVVFAGVAPTERLLARIYPQILMILSYYIIKFRSKRTGYSASIPVSLLFVQCFCLTMVMIPDSFLWTAGFSMGSVIIAYVIVLSTIPLQDLDLSFRSYLQWEVDKIKKQWRSHVFSILTLQILSTITMSVVMKSNDAAYYWCSSNLWKLSVIISFGFILISIMKFKCLQTFLKIGFVASEAFMFGIPFSSVALDRYIFIMFPILVCYFAVLFAEDIQTFTVQTIILWSCFGVGFYCTLNEAEDIVKLYYCLIFGLYISFRLLFYLRDHRCQAEQDSEEKVPVSVIEKT